MTFHQKNQKKWRLNPVICGFVFIFCLIHFASHSQEAVSKETLSELQKQYEDEKAAIIEGKTLFTFSYNKKTGLIEVLEETVMKYASLSGKNEVVKSPIFVDDYSEILHLSVGNVKLSTKTFPYEMNGIFHHDAEATVASVRLSAYQHTTNLNYAIKYTDSKYLTRRYLAEPQAIKKMTYEFIVPKNIKVEILDFHFGEYDIKKSLVNEKKNETMRYVIENLPPFHQEEQSRGWAFYVPHILILTKTVDLYGTEKKMLSDTEDLYGWYAGLVDEIGNESNDLKNFTAQLVSACPDKTCEMKTIFYWVQDNIRYIAFEDGIAGFRPEACQDVMYQKYGDCKGMANLMTEMLKSRDIDARLTWIGTNSIPYDYSIPSLAVDNHMICTVVDEQGYHFLDGTEKYIGFSDIAERIQGRPAMIENGDSYEIVTVPEFPFSRNEEITTVRYRVEEEKLIGEMDYSVKGEGKVRMFNRYNSIGSKDIDDAKRRFFSRGKKDIEVEIISADDLENREADVHWKARFMARNHVNKFGKELYLDWDLHKSYGHASFDEKELKELKGDMDFGAKVFDKEEYVIDPIDGYVLKSVPADFQVSDEHFRLNVRFEKQANGSIKVFKEFVVPKASIPNAKISNWSDSIERLQKEVYKTPIIYQAL